MDENVKQVITILKYLDAETGRLVMALPNMHTGKVLAILSRKVSDAMGISIKLLEETEEG